MLVNYSNSWNSNQMSCKESTVEELRKCRAGHIRFHLYESSNLAGFKKGLVSKEYALEYINKFGIDSSAQERFNKA